MVVRALWLLCGSHRCTDGVIKIKILEDGRSMDAH